MRIALLIFGMALCQSSSANEYEELKEDVCASTPDKNTTDISANSNRWGLAMLVGSLVLGKSVELALLPVWPKASARGIGKMVKALHSRRDVVEILSSGLSAFGAVFLAARMHQSQMGTAHIAFSTAAIVAFEQSLKQGNMKIWRSGPQSDEWEAFNHWVGRPIFYKTAAVTCRYALEKRLQDILRSPLEPDRFASWVQTQSPFSKDSAASLGQGRLVGASKILSGALASSVISIVDISIDCMQRIPQWKTLGDRLQKYLQDIGVALGSSFVISVVMPVALVSRTPGQLIGYFIIGNVIHWWLFS